MGKLTALGIKGALKPGTYQDGDGLMLIVKPSGSRSWIARLQVGGKRRDFGLGSTKDVSLAEAREKAEAIRKLYRSGVDPVAHHRAQRAKQQATPTFKQAAEKTHAERKGAWRNAKHKDDWLSSLRLYAFASLGDIPVDQLTVPLIREVLSPIWLAKPETARRVRQRIKAVMDWAASNSHCDAIDLGVMSKGLPKQPKRDGHFEAMPYQDLPAFLAKIGSENETVGRMALTFTILTAARSGETRGATWAEIHGERWTIPASRMKAGRAHSVPLSPAAMAILDRMRALSTGKPTDPIFPGRNGKPLSDMSLTKILRDMGRTETTHGFRSAFKDWASESATFPDAVSEAALAHIDRDKTRAAYRRTDFFEERVKLMAAWGKFCTGTVQVDDLAVERRAKLTPISG